MTKSLNQTFALFKIVVPMPDWEEVADKASMLIGNALSLWLLISMMGDLLGINVLELARQFVFRPWVIPKEWIELYYPVWYAMEWALLILMLADQVFTMRYYSEGQRMPPMRYVRWMSLAIFIISFWLALLFHYMTFVIIAVFSSISFSYAMFIKKGEE